MDRGGRRGRGRARGRGGRAGASALGKRAAAESATKASKTRVVTHMLSRALYFESEHILDLINLAEERALLEASAKAPQCEAISEIGLCT